jgi:hypothetical protein
MSGYAKLSDLIGKTMASVIQSNSGDGDEIVFTSTTGDIYKLYHAQDCCESVYIEDITGSLDMLVGHPILVAEESSNRDHLDGSDDASSESFTWTFYKFGTVMGWVDIRWFGSSNGYYGESVDFVKTQDGDRFSIGKTVKIKDLDSAKQEIIDLDKLVDGLMED